MRDRAISGTQTAIALAVVGLTAGAVALSLTGAREDERLIAAIAHGLTVAVPAGIGLAVLARRPHDRFARLLIATGVLWALVSLVETSASLSYSVGRVAGWIAEASLVYLLLSFPSGRLTTTLERRTFGVTALVIGLLWLPTALLVDSYPQPLYGHGCTPDC